MDITKQKFSKPSITRHSTFHHYSRVGRPNRWIFEWQILKGKSGTKTSVRHHFFQFGKKLIYTEKTVSVIPAFPPKVNRFIWAGTTECLALCFAILRDELFSPKNGSMQREKSVSRKKSYCNSRHSFQRGAN